jgi:hypothetical protein
MRSSIQSGRLLIVSSLLAALITGFPAASLAELRDIMLFPLSIRSAGMGDTGNADRREAANLARNPALIALMNSVQIAWGHSEVSYKLSTIKLDGILAGGGYQWSLNETTTIGGALAAGYAREMYGYKGWDDHPPIWGAFERSYNAAAGAAVEYRDIVQIGIGIDIKRWKWDNAAENEVHHQILEATVFDGGLAASAVLLRRNDYSVEATAGFAYTNFGGDIKTIQEPIFFPPSGDYPAPEFRRYGLAFLFESPSWSRADRKFETTLPAVSAAFNYDIVDEAFQSNHTGARHALGGEIGAFNMLFLRAGRISREERYAILMYGTNNFVDTSWGIGAGIAFRQYDFRFDYARKHYDKSDATHNYYGLLLDMGW